MLLRLYALAFTVFTLCAGCAPPSDWIAMTPAELDSAMKAGKVVPLSPDKYTFGRPVLDLQAPRPGYTYATDRGPIQIEYFDPNGRSWLWFPGNLLAVPGEYRYQVAFPRAGGPGEVAAVEFRYPSTSRGMDGRPGGSWEPAMIRGYQNGVVSVAKGDVFRLSRGLVPYVRRSCDLPDPMPRPDPGYGVCRR
ncbi:hypothetical protein [Paenirhodobacter sp.]|uniref:hypothetical protein n=1 Tax=Paenirhodobacter sp. TaxID=1965326 RepID=UPI003B3DD30E